MNIEEKLDKKHLSKKIRNSLGLGLFCSVLLFSFSDFKSPQYLENRERSIKSQGHNYSDAGNNEFSFYPVGERYLYDCAISYDVNALFDGGKNNVFFIFQEMAEGTEWKIMKNKDSEEIIYTVDEWDKATSDDPIFENNKFKDSMIKNKNDFLGGIRTITRYARSSDDDSIRVISPSNGGKEKEFSHETLSTDNFKDVEDYWKEIEELCKNEFIAYGQ